MLGQLLVSKIHNIINLRNKIIEKFAVVLISIFLHGRYLHHLVLLQNWHIISQVIGYGCLYSVLWSLTWTIA